MEETPIPKMTSVIIDYWVHPRGTDFAGIEEFTQKVDHSLFLSINKKRTDALGGGLYELAIRIVADITFASLAKSYFEDGIKSLINSSLRDFFEELKALFKKNEELDPGLDELILQYRDCTVKIYSLYPGSIEESVQEILERLCKLQSQHPQEFKGFQKLHVPILNHRDEYDLCSYRVKLRVDEPIRDFKREFYFMFWGITSTKGKLIYDLARDEFIPEKFYTQKSYEKLWERSRDSRRNTHNAETKDH